MGRWLLRLGLGYKDGGFLLYWGGLGLFIMGLVVFSEREGVVFLLL
jgi:hypothetical protein